MKVICCECGKTLGFVPDCPSNPKAVSHGLCHECAAAVLAEYMERRSCAEKEVSAARE